MLASGWFSKIASRMCSNPCLSLVELVIGGAQDSGRTPATSRHKWVIHQQHIIYSSISQYILGNTCVCSCVTTAFFYTLDVPFWRFLKLNLIYDLFLSCRATNGTPTSSLFGTLMILKAACTNNIAYIDRLISVFMRALQKMAREHLSPSSSESSTCEYLPHKVKMQYLHFWSHAEYFLLAWKIPEVMSRWSILFHN